MKEEYYITVRNNPFHPATLIENIVFAALGLFLLYQNNAPIAHASKKTGASFSMSKQKKAFPKTK